jgi:hypothetical protein
MPGRHDRILYEEAWSFAWLGPNMRSDLVLLVASRGLYPDRA